MRARVYSLLELYFEIEEIRRTHELLSQDPGREACETRSVLWREMPATQVVRNGVCVSRDMLGDELKIEYGSDEPDFS